MSNTKRGERPVMTAVQRLMREAAPAGVRPPGETGIELEGGEAVAAMRHRLATDQRMPCRSEVPRLRLSVIDLRVWREGNVVICKVAFGKAGEVTIRLSKYWAKTLYLKLGKALA